MSGRHSSISMHHHGGPRILVTRHLACLIAITITVVIVIIMSALQALPHNQPDHLTVRVFCIVLYWRAGRCVHTLVGHTGEISSTQFNFR